MSGVGDWIRREHEEHQRLLVETPEDSHTHTLWVRRMESQEKFLREHVEDNVHRQEILGHLQRCRELIGKALVKEK